MKEFSKILLIIALSIFTSCKKDLDTTRESEESIRYRYYNLENHGWKSRTMNQKIDGIGYTATEVPIQYYILKEMGNKNLSSVDSVYFNHQNERVYEFIFEQEQQKDLLDSQFTHMDYDSAVRYMSFSIEKDFYAVTNHKDTIACSGVQFERNFKVAPYNKLLLFFGGIKPLDKIQIIYNDKLFGKGLLKFSISEPQLNL